MQSNKKDLLLQLIRTDFKLKYNDSILGLIWVLMKPFIDFAILFTVWSALGRGGDDPNFAVRLMIGILLFSYFRDGMRAGMLALLSMKGIILKVNIPRKYSILSALANALINFLINLTVVIILFVALGKNIHIMGIFMLTIVLLIFSLGIYGASMFLSIWVIRVRDLDNIMDIVLTALFWGSGIFYRIDTLTGRAGELVRLNPVALMIDTVRNGFLYGDITHIENLLTSLVIATLLFLIGSRYFENKSKVIAEYI